MKAFSEETGENLDQMEGHIGYQRLSQEQRDNLFKYFRPFTRKDEQKVSFSIKFIYVIIV